MRVALALFIALAAPSSEAQETLYERSFSQSAREGPWVHELAALERLYEEQSWDRLETALDQAERQMLALYGDDSVAYAEVLMLRGLTLYETDRERASLAVFAASLRHYRAALGDAHIDVALASNSYADAVMETRGGKAAPEALPHYRRALAIYSTALGPTAAETHNTTLWLVRALISQSRFHNDRGSLTEADTIIRAALAYPHLARQPERHVELLCLHGEVFAAMGSDREAEARFVEAVAIIASSTDSIVGSLYSLEPYLDFLQERGRQGEAEALLDRLFSNRPE